MTRWQWLKLKTCTDYLENQKQWAKKFPDAKRIKEGNRFHNMQMINDSTLSVVLEML